MTYERCDVVYGADPFKGEEYSRPWVILSNGSHPFQGDQYIVLALTTKTWHDGLIEIDKSAWVKGGTPDSSKIIPWSIETLEHDDVNRWQRRIERQPVDKATSVLTSYIERRE